MDYLIPLLSGFVGAIIGAASSVAVVLVQTRADRRKEMTKLAVEAALKEHNVHLGQSIVGETLLPVSSYVFIYVRLFELLDKGQITEKSLANLYDEVNRLTDTVRASAQSK
jgi:hypothetical protein